MKGHLGYPPQWFFNPWKKSYLLRVGRKYQLNSSFRMLDSVVLVRTSSTS